jgi:hypothetical protein
VQLVRDQPPLFLHALLDQQRHLTTFLEACLRFAGFALGLDVVLYRLGHSVEGRAHGVSFGPGQRRQAKCELPALDALQPVCDHREWGERTIHRPEGDTVYGDQHDHRNDQEPGDVVPCVEYRA